MEPKNTKLLIVEDGPLTALLYKDFLTGEGYAIRHVSQIEEATHQIETSSFDAILLDLNIQGSSGLNTLRTLALLTETPIVVLTGSIGEETAREAKMLGAVDYLEKDNVRPDIVARVVGDAVVQHKKYRLKNIAERLESIRGGLVRG